jgi:hypothetical protein
MLASTGPAGMKRRSLLNSEAWPLGGRRIFHLQKAAATIVFATPSGSGAPFTFSAILRTT